MLVLPNGLGKLSKIASHQRRSLTGIRVSATGDRFRVEATDGVRAMIVSGPNVPGDATLNGLAERLGDLPGTASTGVVPAKEWAVAFGAAKRYEPVGLLVGDEQFAFVVGQRLFRGDLVQGSFPDVSAAMPRTAPAFVVKVNARQLAEMLLAMDAANPDAVHRAVTLSFYRGHAPLGLGWRTASGVAADGLLMPLIES